jgi:hypothetical protein
MPVQTAIWKVGVKPEALESSWLPKEQLLEDMIVAAPKLLSEEWMLIGRQEDTGLGGRADLLAVAPDGSLVLIELKRDRTPREVVAQALDYASWVVKLRPDEITAIYKRFAPGHSLQDDFKQRFGVTLDEETLNENHQIVIVASSMDASTERIVGYLSDKKVSINVLCFQVFSHGNDQLLSRSWLIDPVKAQVNTASPVQSSDPWNGEFYCSFGEGKSRSWQDAVEYGFVCGGGGKWYSRTLQLLSPDDRIWVKIPDTGFVGVGRVTGRITPASEYKVKNKEASEVPVLAAAKRGSYHSDKIDNPDECEYFVPVQWLQTVPKQHAFYEVGLFGNQNTVCQPTTPKWRFTVERLMEKFPGATQAKGGQPLIAPFPESAPSLPEADF